MKLSIYFIFLLLLSPALASAGEKPENLPEDGVLIQRDDGSWLQITIDFNRAVIAFFDEMGESISPDVAFGTFRFQRPGRARQQLPLYRDGDFLYTARQLMPPHVFNGVILLYKAGETEASEIYDFAIRPSED